VGRMNYIARKNLSREEEPYYDSIRRNYEADHLWELYNKLKRFPRLSFKDSIRIQLGMAGSQQGTKGL
jgi:hypothetical protein